MRDEDEVPKAGGMGLVLSTWRLGRFLSWTWGVLVVCELYRFLPYAYRVAFMEVHLHVTCWTGRVPYVYWAYCLPYADSSTFSILSSVYKPGSRKRMRNLSGTNPHSFYLSHYAMYYAFSTHPIPVLCSSPPFGLLLPIRYYAFWKHSSSPIR